MILRKAMNKIDKKKLVVILALSMAVAFFLQTNVFSPLDKKNKELEEALAKSRQRALAIQEAFKNPKRLADIKAQIKTLDSFLITKIPEEKNITQMTKILGRSKNVANALVNSGGDQEMHLSLSQIQGDLNYQTLGVSVSFKASLKDIVEYIHWIKEQDRLITVKNITLTPGMEPGNLVYVNMELLGYSMNIQSLPFLEVVGDPTLDDASLKEILSLPVPEEIKTSLDDVGEMFGIRLAPKPAVVIAPKPVVEKKSEIKQVPEPVFVLSGTVMKSNSTLAILNNKLVRLNDTIEGYQVVDIESDKVILSKEGKEKILRIKE